MARYGSIGKAFDLTDLSVCRSCGAVVHPTYQDAHDAHHQAIDDQASAADADSERLSNAIERLARR